MCVHRYLHRVYICGAAEEAERLVCLWLRNGSSVTAAQEWGVFTDAVPS